MTICENIIKSSENFGNGFPVKAYKISKGWPADYHAHEYMQIWYILQGKCNHVVDDIIYEMEAGNLLIIPPHVHHGISDESEEFSIMCCEFDFDIVTGDNIFRKEEIENLLQFTYAESFLAHVERTRPCYSLSKVNRIKIELSIETLIDECNNDRPFKEVALKANILQLLTQIVRDVENSTTNVKAVKAYSSFIEKSLLYIHENFNKKIYIDEVSKIASMSESYFSYFFKEHTGKTFKEYITMLKIDFTKNQLIKSSHSITQIAINAGFSDCAHFNKVFKREEGITPLAFRRRHF